MLRRGEVRDVLVDLDLGEDVDAVVGAEAGVLGLSLVVSRAEQRVDVEGARKGQHVSPSDEVLGRLDLEDAAQRVETKGEAAGRGLGERAAPKRGRPACGPSESAVED